MGPLVSGRNVRAQGPIALHCPHCLGSNLWSEPLPGGDTPVECRSCNRIYIYAYVEMFAIDRIRRGIHDSHPESERAAMERYEAEVERMEKKRGAA
jgi:hypothetical protein